MDKATLISQATELLLPVLVAALSWGSLELVRWLRAKTKSTYLQGLLDRVNDTVMTAVKSAEQVTVAALRAANADGRITDEEKAAVKAKVLEEVKSHLGPRGLAEIGKILGLDDGALASLLGSKVEAAVLDLKARSAVVEAAAANPPAPPAG
jgi:hypothetical protein